MPTGAEIVAERMSRAAYSVCRVEIGGNAAGTGFLIGPDTVITNFHVVAPVLAKDKSRFTKPVTCRFDHAQLSDGGFRQGRVVAVSEQCPDWSEYAASDELAEGGKPPADDQLDYALLSLCERVGEQPSPATWTRGWISIPPIAARFRLGQPLIIIQHPLTAPKVITRSIRITEEFANRITYHGETYPGSSGSPCFSEDFELVALHHRGDPAFDDPRLKQGIPIAKIRERLLTRALSDKFPECPGVESAKSALDAIVDNKGGGEIADFIAHWKDSIEETRDGVLRLKVQKQLHDFLHRCQKLVFLLLVTLRSKDAANARDELEVHGGNLLADVASIRTTASELPAEIRRRRVDNATWIAAIEATAKVMTDPAATWPDAFRTAILMMRSRIKQQLGLINERLVDEVASLPLQQLENALRDLAGMDHELFPGAKKAGEAGALAIASVTADLTKFIQEHDRWQAYDGQLWACEDYLASESPMSFELFEATWDDVWPPLQDLLAKSRDPAKTQPLLNCGAAVQTARASRTWPTAQTEFGRFRRLSVNNFADLDTALLKKCDEITALHEPLRRLTE